jgi:hypothetical protein
MKVLSSNYETEGTPTNSGGTYRRAARGWRHCTVQVGSNSNTFDLYSLGGPVQNSVGAPVVLAESFMKSLGLYIHMPEYYLK